MNQEEMMRKFVEHVKANHNHISAGALVEALGVSYPKLPN